VADVDVPVIRSHGSIPFVRGASRPVFVFVSAARCVGGTLALVAAVAQCRGKHITVPMEQRWT
jgi:hypothetical protein